MIRRLRMILPPGSVLFLAAVMYPLTAIPMLVSLRRFGFAPQESKHLLTFYVVCLLIAYSLYRVIAFHPAYNPGYRRWLESTPWTWRKGLPGGPVHLTWEDAIILFAIVLPAWFAGALSFSTALTVFLAMYVAILAPTFSAAGAPMFGYAATFGLGMVVRLAFSPWGSAITACIVAIVALLGLRRSLRNFPWEESKVETLLPKTSAQMLEAAVRAGRRLGWPYDRLGPKAGDAPAISGLNQFLGSLLLGWWCYALLSILHPVILAAIMHHGFIYMVAFLALGRLMSYVAGFAPPLNVFGRIATLRLIIPGYDRVFLPPLAMLLIGRFGPGLLLQAGLPDSVAWAATLALVVYVMMSAAPSIQEWRLTGKHRLVSFGVAGTSSNQQTEFVQVG
jgi:hypothetical protein